VSSVPVSETKQLRNFREVAVLIATAASSALGSKHKLSAFDTNAFVQRRGRSTRKY